MFFIGLFTILSLGPEVFASAMSAAGVLYWTVALASSDWSEPMILSQTVSISSLALLMVILLLTNFFCCVLAAPTMSTAPLKSLNLVLFFLTAACYNFFFTSSLMSMFIYFELSLVPIFLIVMGWGYQSERVKAGLALFMYTSVGAAPLLMVILTFSSTGSSGLLSVANESGVTLSKIIFWPMFAFLIKLPLAGAHMWLPKAHVEAPVVGSMFLAAVLLKLGGWGLVVFNSLLEHSVLSQLLLALSMLGMLWISVICCQTVDSKTLIAFSSVTHMSMMTIGAVVGSFVSINAGFLVLLSHGFSSSVAFLLVFYMYKSQNSRSLVLSKSMLSSCGTLDMVWVFVVLALIGCPPSFNLWVEMMCYYFFAALDPVMSKTFFVAALLGGVYGFLLLGKALSGADLNFKHPKEESQLELMQASYSVGLTISMSISLSLVMF